MEVLSRRTEFCLNKFNELGILTVTLEYYLLTYSGDDDISDIESITAEQSGSNSDLDLGSSESESEESNQLPQKNTEMTDQALRNSFNSLSLKIEQYSGTESDRPVTDFVDDLKDYIATTGKTSPAKITVGGAQVDNPQAGKLEKLVLQTALRGAAKTYYDQLDRTKTFDECIEKLKGRFQLTDQQKHKAKLQVYRLTQEPHEQLIDFVSRVTSRARGLDMKDKDLITIITEGAAPNVRTFLEMIDPKDLDELMKYPFIRSI